MEDIDTLLMVGTNFPYTKHLPEPGKVTVVQVEIDPTRVGTRMPTDVPLVGDVGATLRGAAAAAAPQPDRKHLETVPGEDARLAGAMAALRDGDRDPIAPQYLAGLLDELATDDAILTCDSGTIATWAARHWHDPRRPRVLPVRQPRHDGARPAVRDRRSSTPTRTGRSSRSSATAGSRC